MPEQPFRALVEADRSRLWSAGWWYLAVGTPIFWFFLWGALLSDDLGTSHTSVVVAVLAGPLIAAGLGFGPCLLWRWRLAKTAYGIEDGELVAKRGSNVLVSVALDEVDYVAVEDWMNTRRLLTTMYPPDCWPALVVLQRNGTNVWFPKVMVWGKDASGRIGDVVQHGVEEARRSTL